MTVRRLDHIVLAVQQMERAVRAWSRTFDLKPDAPVRPADTNMELSFLQFDNAFLELVRATTDGHRVARHVAEHGEGMFSISLEVDDLNAAVRELRAKGATVSDPESGVLPETRIARIPRASAHGVAVQLIERRRS